jgi:chemotaxis protein MotB
LAIEQEHLKVPKSCRIRIIDCCQRSNNEKLKETLSNALNSFEGKGLTVEQKNREGYTYPWKTNYCLIPVVRRRFRR